MRPLFALDLAHDGIRLLYRAEGGWTVVGDVALDDPFLDSRLAGLRADAEELAPGEVTTELVIPPSQILYTRIPLPAGGRLTEATIRPCLEGLTPVHADELEFDWIPDGGTLRLAILERQTLREAEDFAHAHGFRPVAFTARPQAGEFPRPPDFGATSMADRFDADAEPVAFASRRGRTAAQPIPATTLTLTPTQRAAPDEGAQAIARSLAARPRPNGNEAGARSPFGKRGIAASALSDPRLIFGLAAAIVIAAMIWGIYFMVRTDGPDDPAAALSDIPPAVAATAPEITPPEPDPFPAQARMDDAAIGRSLAGPAALPPEPSAGGTALSGSAAQPPRLVAGENPALRYAATGIWLEGPTETSPPEPGSADEIYFASIDPSTRSSDAIALISPSSLLSEPRPPAEIGPAPADTAFDLDDRGLVRATPDGALTPQGIEVTLGRPPLVPPSRPVTERAEPPPVPTNVAALPDTRPRQRPGGLVERTERASLGGRTRIELAGLRPQPRPAALAVVPAPPPPTDSAIAVSIQPRLRPDGLTARISTDRAVAAALADEADDEPEISGGGQPDIPTSASVARQATIENAIRLRDLNLIGVYGSEGNRRALVRLPSGRYVKVEVGDNLDGGRIAAIGRNELRYVKGGRNITLTVPSG